MNKQADFVEESSIVITEIVKSISSVYQITEQVKTIGDGLSLEAAEGTKMVAESSVAIHDIAKSSNNVKDIVNGIKEISENTNILAMNAAIQSAHAGEYGRGFAVVADEVRSLSENSAGRAAEINNQIDSMINKISNGVQLFDRVKDGLEKILDGIKKTTKMIIDISDMSQKQYSGTNQVISSMNALVKATESLKNQTQKQMEDSEKIRASLNELKEVAIHIESSTYEQSVSGDEIADMIEKIKHISTENRVILEKLDGLIKISEKDFGL